MNKTWLIVGLIVAIILGLVIFGNVFADGRQALARPKAKSKADKKGIALYATDETVNLNETLAGH